MEILLYVAMTVRISFRSSREGRLIAKICWKLRVELATFGSTMGAKVGAESEESSITGFRAFEGESGNCDNGDDEPVPPCKRSQVNVPVTTRNAMNMTPAVLLHDKSDRRRFLRLEEAAQLGIAYEE